jgi:hypothetical protein
MAYNLLPLQLKVRVLEIFCVLERGQMCLITSICFRPVLMIAAMKSIQVEKMFPSQHRAVSSRFQRRVSLEFRQGAMKLPPLLWRSRPLPSMDTPVRRLRQ